MIHLQTVDGFFRWAAKHNASVESLHCGNAVYYLAFFAGRCVAQYVEYLNQNNNLRENRKNP